jgi:hypothetical protein
MERDIVKRIEDLMDLFDEGEVTTADQIQRPEDPYRDFMDRNPLAGGGRIGFQRPLTTVGKTADIVNYLKDLPNGSSFYKPDVAKLLNLGTAKDGSIDTSLLTRVINSRPELKNKKFKFLTKTDVTVNKINNFVQDYVNENKGKLPSQGEIQKGAKVDPTRLRNYITEGLIKNVADTVFDKNTKVANYILESKNPTIKDIEKIVGKGNANKILTRVYINSLRSTKDKLNKIDEGRSVYKNFNLEQVDLIKNKLRKIPGFESIYEREITDLVADAYPGKKNLKKKKAALKKIAKFKQLNKTLKNKFGINQVLDHPLDYDFITKTTAGSDPTELIRVRPLPERVNTFKSLLTKDFTEISETLKKGYNQAAYDKYLDAKSIADDLGIAFPKMAKTGTIISPAAAKIGDKPIIGDIKQSAVIQNKFRKFVQNISNDPRIQRLGINIKELKDLAKLPEINISAYNKAVKNFALKSGKFGVPFVVAAGGADFLKKQGVGFDKEFEQTAAVGDAPIVEKGLSTGEKTAIGTGAALGIGTKIGRNILGRAVGGAFGPTGLGLLTATGGGYDLSSPLDRFILGAEATFAPDLVKGTIGATKGMKNRALQKIAQRALNLGVSIPTALKVSRVLSPIGLMSILGERSIAAGKNISEEANRIDAIQDKNLQQLEYENLIKNIKGFARGGLSGGDKSGPPPERGPNPQGLLSLKNRVRNL